MASKIDEYRAGALRWEQRAKEARNQTDRGWQLSIADAYRMLATVERSALHGKEIQANKATA